MNDWTKEALSSLIHEEYQAGNFYRYVAEKIKNPKPKKVMLKIAEDEDKHRETLGKWYKTRFGDRFMIDPKKPELPDYNFEDADILEQAKAVEVLSFAIDVEGRFIETYKELSKTAPSEEDGKAIKKMAKDETGHRKKLQKQYAKMQKMDNFWSIL